MEMKWEAISSKGMSDTAEFALGYMHRAKVPGGWFIVWRRDANAGGIAFYPDPHHKWDGNSLP
jgi:hypothetical protein